MSMWNQKRNKCKTCGHESESILKGMIHLREHRIRANYQSYRKYLEMIN